MVTAFTFKLKWWHIIKNGRLSWPGKLEVLAAVFDYVETGQTRHLTKPAAQMAFDFIKKDIDDESQKQGWFTTARPAPAKRPGISSILEEPKDNRICIRKGEGPDDITTGNE